MESAIGNRQRPLIFNATASVAAVVGESAVGDRRPFPDVVANAAAAAKTVGEVVAEKAIGNRQCAAVVNADAEAAVDELLAIHVAGESAVANCQRTGIVNTAAVADGDVAGI